MKKNIFYSKHTILGFSLIELLVAVSIIAVLSALGMANYKTVSQKGRDAKRKADMEQMRGALELYRADEARYPAALPDCNLPLDGPVSDNTFMKSVPCDPADPDTIAYEYSVDAQGRNYTLGTYLEVDDDSGDCSVFGSGACNGEDCNYCITNP